MCECRAGWCGIVRLDRDETVLAHDWVDEWLPWKPLLDDYRYAVLA
jgi:hypothetical protein